MTSPTGSRFYVDEVTANGAALVTRTIHTRGDDVAGRVAEVLAGGRIANVWGDGRPDDLAGIHHPEPLKSDTVPADTGEDTDQEGTPPC